VTESEWQAGVFPNSMLEQLRSLASDRKLRLYLVACSHMFLDRLGDPRLGWLQEVVDVSERFADGRAKRKEIEGARKLGKEIWGQIPHHQTAAFGTAALAWNTTRDKTFTAAMDASVSYVWSANARRQNKGPLFGDDKVLSGHLCSLLRDIFGNPFRPSVIAPDWLAWNDGTVVKLARTIYEDRRWDIMPILGDALEDAMCDNDYILQHCRGPGPHARGCWVVDLILGKE
jgi:hypothetical protein